MTIQPFAALLFAGMTLLGAAEAPVSAAPEVLSATEMAAILQKTATLRLAPDLAHLTPGERSAVKALLEVGAIFQRLYEDSRHPAAERERNRLGAEPTSDASRLFRLFQGPIATTLDNRRVAFLPVEPESPGKNFYPAGITAQEMKSDLVSLFAMQRLADAGLAPPERLAAVRASGILRVLNDNRPRRDQPYQLMQLVQFNWFLDRGLLSATADRRLEIHDDKYAAAVASLLEEVLALQQGGDPAVVEAFFTRWTTWDENLHEAIGKRMRDAQTTRYNLVRYAALEE